MENRDGEKEEEGGGGGAADVGPLAGAPATRRGTEHLCRSAALSSLPSLGDQNNRLFNLSSGPL